MPDRLASKTSASNLVQMRDVHKDLLEKALHMRCVSYLADAKAQLLIQTVATVGESKRDASASVLTLRESLEALRREVKARKQLERELREITDAVEHAPIMILVGRGNSVVYTNDTFISTFGAGAGDGSLTEVLQRLAVHECVPRVPQDGSPWTRECEMKTRSGATIRARVTIASKAPTRGEEHHFAVIEDVSAEHQAQQRIVKSQHLESLGQLVGGIAHDFNNLLMLVATNIEQLLELPDVDTESVLHETLEAALRGGQLTKQLLAFARRQVLSPERVDVVPAVRKTLALLERTIGEDRKLRSRGVAGAAVCDPGQLEAALVNLVLNARDASKPGTEISIELSEYENPAPRICGPGDLPIGRFVAITVQDDGPGIPPELSDRVWEPFFSEKDQKQHSGMGLSMVSGFAQQSGGGAEIANSPRGARITLYLPAAK